MKYVFTLLFGLLVATTTQAQSSDTTAEKTDTTNCAKKKHPMSLSLSTDGLSLSSTDSSKKEKRFGIEYGVLDLGFNRLDDKTNYNTPEAIAFMGYRAGQPNAERPFALREGKSINVNVWLLMTKLRLLKTSHQRIYLTSGLGLQMYNFRWDGERNYTDNPAARMELVDSNNSLNIEKNKLGMTYASIPLSLLFKTKLANKTWLVYGFGITGGYRIASWTKLKTAEQGKEKNFDKFNFNDFNSCVTAEIGIDNYVRLYASYQLTALHDNVFDQHPYAIGIRFSGL